MFNFPKIHLLSHYGSQITDFGKLPHYSNEVTEALHKPLKYAYRRSNRVDMAEQILDRITRDYAIRIWELNLIAWSWDVKMPAEVQKMLKDVAADRQEPGKAEREPKHGRNGRGLGGKQGAANLNGIPLASLAEELGLPCLTERFPVYLMLNMPGGRPLPDTEKIYNYWTPYYSTISVPVAQFQGEGEVIHRVRWSRKQKFRKRKPRADSVWVCRRERLREELQVGQLDGKTVGRQEGLFSVRKDMGMKHKVALVEILGLLYQLN